MHSLQRGRTVVATSCGLMPDSTPRRCSWNWCTYSSRISSAASVRLNVTARPSASDACFDHKAFDHQFVDKLRDAWCGYLQIKALMPLTRAAGAGDPARHCLSIPDGVDDMHVTRLHVFRAVPATLRRCVSPSSTRRSDHARRPGTVVVARFAIPPWHPIRY